MQTKRMGDILDSWNTQPSMRGERNRTAVKGKRHTKEAPSQTFAKVPPRAAIAKSLRYMKRGRKPWLVSDGELRYFVALCMHTDGRSGVCKVSQGQIAASLGYSGSLASRHERSLEKKGFIRVRRTWRRDNKTKRRSVDVLYPHRKDWPEYQFSSY